jgi:hypothetical protein
MEPPRPGAVIAARTFPMLPADAFALVTDVRRHGDWIPFTRVEVDGPLREGTHLRAVTGPFARHGGAGFVDGMRVVRLAPPVRGKPGVAHFVREGPALRGWARIVVRDDPAGSLVVWAEEASFVGPLPQDLTARLVAPVLALVIRVALRGAARSVHA